MNPALPLILTFSRWEKEQQLHNFLLAKVIRAAGRFRFAKNLGAIPPLPAGEGRGEGEHADQTFKSTFASL